MYKLSPSPVRRLTLLGAASLLALATTTGAPTPARAQTPAPDIGSATWTSPLVSPTNDTLAQLNTPPATFTNQTIRLIARISVGGESVRVRISNVFGTQNLNVGAARIALRATGANTVPGTDRQLLFSGQPTVSIPPGALILSDPVSLSAPTLGDLAISIYFPDAVTAGDHAPALLPPVLLHRHLRHRRRHGGDHVSDEHDEDGVVLPDGASKCSPRRPCPRSSRSAIRSPKA